ncbi:MAG: MFS transporter [Rhodospirillales bacterium]
MSNPAAAPAIPSYRRNLTLLSVLQALSLSCTSMSIVATPIAAYSIADVKELSTLPIALQQIGIMASTFPASFLMRRFGRRIGFMVGASLGIVGALMCIYAMFSATFLWLCVGLFFVGTFLGHSQYYRFAAAEVAPPILRARAISWVLAGGVLAAVIGPNMANYSKDWFAPVFFAGTYTAMIGLLVLTLIVAWFVRVPQPTALEMSGPQRPLLTIMAQPVFLIAAGGAVIAYAVMSLLMTATPFAMHACDLPFSDTAFVISAHVLGMFVPSFFSGWLITRFGVLNIMLVGIALLLAAVAVDLSGVTLTHFWIGLTLLGVGWNFLFTGGTTLVTTAYTASERAKSQAINDFMVFGTTGVASLSAGILHETYGWAVLNYLALPLICIALVVVLIARLRQRIAAA